METASENKMEAGAALNHVRYLDLLGRFWLGSRMSRAELDELDRLYKLSIAHVWESTASNDKEP